MCRQANGTTDPKTGGFYFSIWCNSTVLPALLRVCARFGELRKGPILLTPITSRVVLTYGSFDLFHQGHAQLLQKLSSLGTELIVGCSTDAYNEKMGVPSVTSYAQRRLTLESCRFVSRVIAEQDWDQKYTDIINYNVSVFAMGEEWSGQFDDFQDITQVLYIPRSTIIGERKPFHMMEQPALRAVAGL